MLDRGIFGQKRKNEGRKTKKRDAPENGIPLYYVCLSAV
jgi:hypothetical protein